MLDPVIVIPVISGLIIVGSFVLHASAHRDDRPKRDRPAAPRIRTITLRWPWWLHPMWALLVLTGVMAVVAITVSASTYASAWQEQKYINGNAAELIIIGLAAMALGMLIGTGTARGGTVTVTFDDRQVRYLRRTYRLLFLLTLVGYVLWIWHGRAEGVGLHDLQAVLARQQGALTTVKSNSRPIAGLTTLTQFAPVAISIGFILRRLGETRRWYWLLVLLAIARAVFYAERLAIIEVLVPLMVLTCLTVNEGDRARRFKRAAPVAAVPMLWALFAVSEYARSWVYYQTLVGISFPKWVTLRLLGYYTTSFNDSALFMHAHQQVTGPPYFSLQAIWNMPGVDPHTAIASADWWTGVLHNNANPDFNNTGSFLVTFSEFGTVGGIIFWLLLGLVLGAIFAAMSRGSIPGVIAYASIFVGILELSRFTYWTLGRATPILLAALLIRLTYPRLGSAPEPQTDEPHVAGQGVVRRVGAVS